MTCIVDTNSIHLAIASGTLSAGLIVDPASGIPPNPLVINAAGVYAQGSDGWLPLPVALAYLSADGHTFVATTSVDLTAYIGAGDRIKLTQSATVKYFIVTAISGSTITLYGGTDYVLANAAISVPYFSKAKSPAGFPLSPVKWTEELRDTVQRAQLTAAANTWYNPGALSLAIPIGAWWAEWTAEVAVSGAVGNTIQGTLSTANNSESDTDFTTLHNSPGISYGIMATRRKALVLAAKTSYFLNVRTTSGGTPTVYTSTGDVPTIVRAVCAYL